MRLILCRFGIFTHLVWLNSEADVSWNSEIGKLAALNYFTFLEFRFVFDFVFCTWSVVARHLFLLVASDFDSDFELTL